MILEMHNMTSINFQQQLDLFCFPSDITRLTETRLSILECQTYLLYVGVGICSGDLQFIGFLQYVKYS